jgi:hypothetical protein
VTHPLLQRPQGHVAGGGDPGAKRVPEIVEAHDANVGSPASLLEALVDRRAIQWPAGGGVREDDIVVVGEQRGDAELVQRLAHLLAIGTPRVPRRDSGP